MTYAELSATARTAGGPNMICWPGNTDNTPRPLSNHPMAVRMQMTFIGCLCWGPTVWRAQTVDAYRP